MRASAVPVLCVVALVVCAPGSAHRVVDDPCIRAGETPVQLTTSDGASVYGVEIGDGSTGIVLGHQYLSDHCELIDVARQLASAGYRALTIDFRGFGASSGGAAYHYERDVEAAVARLRADGALRVKLVGASMGGTAVLVAASSIAPPVDGVVSLSGPARYHGLDALRAVRRSRIPVRFVVGKTDRPFAADAVMLMKAAAARDKAILRLAGGRHGSSLLDQPRGLSFVLQFLGR